MPPANDDAPALLTIAELSAATGVPVPTLRRYKARRVIRFHQPGGPGCRVWFPRDALDGGPPRDPEGPPSPNPPSPLPGRKPSWKKN